VAERGLGALNEGLADVADTECCLVWRRDAVVDDGSQVERDVVLGHAHLLRHLDDLDLDVDLDKLLRQWVDVDKTWIDGASKTTKLGNEANVALRHGLVWVGTNNAAWNGSSCSNTTTKGVDLVRLDVYVANNHKMLTIEPYHPLVSAS